MRSTGQRFLVLCGVLASISNWSALAQERSDAQSYQPVVGEAHADFILPAIDDRRPLRLSDFRGRKVLLVHFASW